MKTLTLILTTAASLAAAVSASAAGPIQLQAESAQFDSSRMETVDRRMFSGGKGVMLRSGQKSQLPKPSGEPDLTFKVNIPRAGRYQISSFCDTSGAAREAMKRAKTKFDSLYIVLAVDDDFPRSRVLIPPWGHQDGYYSRLMKQEFSGGKHVVRVWLPEGSALDRLEIAPYRGPAVPPAAQRYTPKLTPPATHPRLYCNAETLPAVKANLTKDENLPLWQQVQREAAVKFPFKPVPPGSVAEHNPKLQIAAVYKAFVYLMTGDREMGGEAVGLMRGYIGTIEFGNMLDICRELGEVIYHASLVYDWCYDLLTPEDRQFFRRHLMRLADDMEIGWPPFGSMIVNGHGNEAQVNRDLLSMSIALYGEYNIPYQYCAYRIFEELVPMRNFEYQGHRHNQGSLYGNVRYGNETYGAMMLYLMSGKHVFDDSFGKLYYYFIYALAPSGAIMPDGDCHWSDRVWRAGIFTMRMYAYCGEPAFRGHFEMQGGSRGMAGMSRLEFLFYNDPAHRESKPVEDLPLTRYFGGEIPSMIARTGWTFGKLSPDVFVEMKGGGYHVANHQHSDAGAFQIYYRGWLATDLGQYHFYGSPYDYGYNKRSIAHNVMLAYQPGERFAGSPFNDGGQRLIVNSPGSLRQLLSDRQYRVGSPVAADFGPDEVRPFYSYFKANLAAAYSSDKVKEYTRTFCFLNLAGAGEPAALITVDRMKTAKASYRKYWTFNSLTEPKIDGASAVISTPDCGRVKVRMLLPRRVKVETAGNGDAAKFFGSQVTPPYNDALAKGWRTMFTPAEENASDLFVSVMQIGDAGAEPPPVRLDENSENCQITIGDRAVVLGTSGHSARLPFKVRLPADRGDVQLLLSDLTPGTWNVRGAGGKFNRNVSVSAGKTTAFLILPGGEYQVSPGAAPGAAAYETPRTPAPKGTASAAGRGSCLIEGRPVTGAPENRVENGQVLTPAEKVFAALGAKCRASDGELQVDLEGRSAVFRDGSSVMECGGKRYDMAAPARRVQGVWYVCASVVGGLSGRRVTSDEATRSAVFVGSVAPASLLFIDSNCGFSGDDWKLLQDESTSKVDYWAEDGVGRSFTVAFPEVSRCGAVAVRFHEGDKRAEKFKLEVFDGSSWKTVHDGESMVRPGTEVYAFPAREVAQLRFTGYGNNLGSWNSIVSLVLRKEE